MVPLVLPLRHYYVSILMHKIRNVWSNEGHLNMNSQESDILFGQTRVYIHKCLRPLHLASGKCLHPLHLTSGKF